MSFVGSEDYIRAQFEEYVLALLSSVKYDNYIQRHSSTLQNESVLPEIGTLRIPTQLIVEGVPVRDFGAAWVEEWRHTSNYAIWMSLTDQELFDVMEPKHPCAGASTLSLEDVQLRVQQKMHDLKLDEKMAQSKEVLSRTWVSGSTKVRGAVESAWAGLDQYRSQRKLADSTGNATSPTAATAEKDANGAKRESFVGGWAAWAAEKRKRAFQREEPVRIERVDIGPAPARPLAQWAKRNSDAGGSGIEPAKVESVKSSSESRVDGKEGNVDTAI